MCVWIVRFLGALSMALRASRGMPLRPGAFPFLSLGNGTFDFAEGNRSINVGKAWLLRNEFKDGVVNGSVVIEDFVKVHHKPKYGMD